MKITLLAFGPLSDVLGRQQSLELEGPISLAALRQHLEQQYPGLTQYSYKLALNEQFAEGDETIQEHDTLAIIPPYSGG
jgi:molybdopterin synthase sulfur carrier subunit